MSIHITRKAALPAQICGARHARRLALRQAFAI
jgi:hypothetical protein